MKKTKTPFNKGSDPFIVKESSKSVSFKRKSKVKSKEIEVIRLTARRGDLDFLKQERGLLYPAMPVGPFLKMKGYTETQRKDFFDWSTVAEWNEKRDEIQNKVTTRVAERHIDVIADAEDLFLRTAKIGILRIIEMFNKLPVVDIPELVSISDPINPRKKKVVKKNSLRSVDIANLMLSLKTGQEIYRKALGLSNESEGLKKVLDEIKGMTVGDINLTNININSGLNPTSEGEAKLIELTDPDRYDDLYEAIEMKRKLKQKEPVKESTMGE